MMGTAGIYAAAIVLALLGGTPAAEQSGSDPAALRARIERRFDVLPLRDGFVLRPKSEAASQTEPLTISMSDRTNSRTAAGSSRYAPATVLTTATMPIPARRARPIYFPLRELWDCGS